jgi:hypothetical protein
MEQDVDAAIEIAAERTREAQEELLEKVERSSDVEDEARRVVYRAQDLHELTTDAVDAAGSPPSREREEGTGEG